MMLQALNFKRRLYWHRTEDNCKTCICSCAEFCEHSLCLVLASGAGGAGAWGEVRAAAKLIAIGDVRGTTNCLSTASHGGCGMWWCWRRRRWRPVAAAVAAVVVALVVFVAGAGAVAGGGGTSHSPQVAVS